MIYSFSLASVSIFLGIIYILSHGFALLKFETCRDFLFQIPRNTAVGIGLMVIATAWFIWLILEIDLMEYSHLRQSFLTGSIITCVLVIFFVREFLTARAAGALLLLLAQILLDAAFLRDDAIRLIVTLTAYFYVLVGMFFVGAPYLMRDAFEWIYRTESRAKIAAGSGVAFGVLLLGLGLFVY